MTSTRGPAISAPHRPVARKYRVLRRGRPRPVPARRYPHPLMSSPAPKRRSVYADRLHEHGAFVFSDHTAGAHRGLWRSFFTPRIGAAYDQRVILEIGCNDAALLTTLAAKHPQTAFVGLDWKAKALHDAAGRVASAGLSNVALVRARAQDLLHLFAEGELDEIWIFHPDPCAGPDELRHRLFAEPFLVDAYAALRSEGSTLSLKTDHPGYYQWALALFGLPVPPWFRSPDPAAPKVRHRDLTPSASLPAASTALQRLFAVGANSPNYWNDPAVLAHTASRAFANEVTTFESRFLRKRQPIYYLELRKKQ